MPSPPHRPVSSRIALFWLTGLSLVTSLACVAFGGYLGLAASSDATANAMREMTGQADGLARQIEGDVALFDLALREAAAQTPVPDGRDGGQPSARVPILAHPLTSKQIEFIDILNEVGDVIADSRSNVSRPVNFAGRDYFQDQLKNPADTLMIGRPFATAPNQHAAIPISRRLNGPDGKFAGVVVAGVYLTWLRDVLSHPLPGTHISVTVRREDGTILMRTPFDADAIGRMGDPDPAWQAYQRTGMTPAEDSKNSIRIFRRTGGVPLVLELSEDRAAFGAEGRVWLVWLPLLPLVPGLFALALGFVAFTLQGRRDQVEAAAHRANDERMRLLATMSHELRTPLTGILGQVELLRDEGGLNEHQADRLARLSQAGTSMRDIVNRVIDISRPEDHVITPVLAPCDLDILIRTCRGMVETFAKAKGLRLTGHVDPSAPKYAKLDRGLVEQVLVNLLMNAVTFTTIGTVDLRLTGETDRLRFEVADTGPGIPRGKRHRLFREYDRLDTKDTRSVGTGLGLWITETIVSRLGGRIGHLENPGGGSVFWFELPFVPVGSRDVVATGAREIGPHDTSGVPVAPGSVAPKSGAPESGTPVQAASSGLAPEGPSGGAPQGPVEAPVTRPTREPSGSSPARGPRSDTAANSPAAWDYEPEMEALPPVAQANRHLRILLADDMDVTRDVTADFLRSAGHAVTEVRDGEAATYEARTRDFDIILTDMRMPVVDGLETTRRIRALPGHRGRTPIVLVTADLAALSRGTSGQDGIDLCVMKPFTRAELLAAVDVAACLTPVPDAEISDSPVLDQSILAQLYESLGEARVDAHLRAAIVRIEALLRLLERPDASRDSTVVDAVHDLVGVAGMMGLTALAICLRQFDTAEDRAAPARALNECAVETVMTLRRRPEHSRAVPAG